jgi:methylated-DNA-[protein]-cysteine S-methyltransferase
MEIAHIQTPLGIAKITETRTEFPLFLFQMKELFRLQLPVLQAAVTQLNEYFEGKRHSFSFKLNPQELNSNKSMESVIRYSIW